MIDIPVTRVYSERVDVRYIHYIHSTVDVADFRSFILFYSDHTPTGSPVYCEFSPNMTAIFF